tara:strand:+ start:1075 stop:1422 length:348 start_codon:yes stop_codon:yes gene_type:complete
MPSIDKFALASMFIFMALAFIFVVLFARISIKHINKKMLKDNITPPLWDKGVGASAPFYAMAIFFKRSRLPTPLFDGRFKAKHARPVDKVLAFLHLFTMAGLTISVFTAMYLDTV